MTFREKVEAMAQVLMEDYGLEYTDALTRAYSIVSSLTDIYDSYEEDYEL